MKSWCLAPGQGVVSQGQTEREKHPPVTERERRQAQSGSSPQMALPADRGGTGLSGTRGARLCVAAAALGERETPPWISPEGEKVPFCGSVLNKPSHQSPSEHKCLSLQTQTPVTPEWRPARRFQTLSPTVTVIGNNRFGVGEAELSCRSFSFTQSSCLV